VDFAVEGLTKGGKVRKGFTATITTPQNLEPVPWAAWSGGETQRLRLAGALGLADLIAAKSGQHVGFEVYDEPSQYLSAAGIESMVSVLRDRATSMKKSIFLIDHRHLDSTNFAGMITVVKNTDGCTVVSSQ
jgi:energy-coupling factor transporter ATP-binding protein EcfA2